MWRPPAGVVQNGWCRGESFVSNGFSFHLVAGVHFFFTPCTFSVGARGLEEWAYRYIGTRLTFWFIAVTQTWANYFLLLTSSAP